MGAAAGLDTEQGFITSCRWSEASVRVYHAERQNAFLPQTLTFGYAGNAFGWAGIMRERFFCTQTCTKLKPQLQSSFVCIAFIAYRDCHASVPFPLCRGGMGEALWIRRGTLARMACATQNCVILTPRASVSTGGRICGVSDTMFFSCFLAISGLKLRKARAQQQKASRCFSRRGDPQ